MLRFGMIVFPQANGIDALVERWKRAEAMGFDSIWVADEAPMQFPGLIHYEAWALLGVLARETSRVKIGTAVTSITFRHPLLLAMSASTIDHASAGRLVIGIGAGGSDKGEAGVGVSWTPRGRADRLEQQVEILDALLRGETVTREDGPYVMRAAQVEPPLQRPRPPIMVAAQGRRGLGVVARFADVWNTLGGQPTHGAGVLPLADAVAETRHQTEALDEACRAIGRDPGQLTRSLFVYRVDPYASMDAFSEIVAAYRPLGITEFILGWPRALGAQTLESRERILERLVDGVLPDLRRE
jgi:alkanesulfonate monooxygenase SsuD/methylene tetrahydromethanopterin reductase-like flavin-dependent oxidoreductase (luciferase family)